MPVYATHTGARGITGRRDDILTRHGSGRSASRPPRDASATPVRSSWCDCPTGTPFKPTRCWWLRNCEARWPPGEAFRRTGWRPSATAGAIC